MSRPLSVLLVFFLVVFVLSMPAAAYEMSIGVRAEFTPVDYKIEPIDDGTKIVPMTPIMQLYFWEYELKSIINRLFLHTPYHEFVQLRVTPFLSQLLGGVPFIVFFFRKKPNYTKTNTTAGKILSFLELHPVSSEPVIIRGVGKSRGAVARQLHCLLFDSEIYAAEISGKIYYSRTPIRTDEPETAVYILKNNETQSAIFAYICDHPGTTRKELAETFSLSVSTIRYHVGSIDQRLIKKEQIGGVETYTAEEWAREIFISAVP